MLKVLACLGGVFVIWISAEWVYRQKLLRGEYLRKFGHVSNATFIAAWPWLINFRAITWLGVALVIGALINRASHTTHLLGGVPRESYGDILFGVAVIVCSLITQEKIFFAIAMLHLGWADGLAAVVGTNFNKRWAYKMFGQIKTVLGSMTFWIISMDILAGALLLGANDIISYSHYAILLLVLPPILTFVEGIGYWGLDNLTVPVVTVIALRLVQA